MARDDRDRRTRCDGPTAWNRRTLLAGAGTALVGVLAGCSGGGGDGGSDGGDSDGESGGGGDTGDGGESGDGDSGGSTDGDSDGTSDGGGDDGQESADGDDSPTRESMGEIAENAVPGIGIVGWSSEASGDIFQVTVTIENGGDETIAPESYTWGLRMYGDDDGEINSGARPSAITLGDNDEVASGDRGEVLIEARPDDASAVASYELFLTCEGQYADGAYCPG